MKNFKDINAVRENSRKTQTGRIVIHQGDREKRIFPEELDKYLQEGWEKGTSEKHRKNNSDPHKGKEPWNKGTKGVMPGSSTSFKPGRDPWNKGKKGVQVSWCKGLDSSDPRLQKRNQALKDAWATNDERRAVQSAKMKLNRGKKLEGEKLQHFLDAVYATKSKNNTFSTSKPEELFYLTLCEQYGSDNVKRQYRDKQRYPFRCDFYIISEDLFIELNLHWTHGGHPFNPEDPEDCEKLKVWQEKARQSKFYAGAILIWTVRDPLKLKIAEDNELNYITIYNLDEEN